MGALWRRRPLCTSIHRDPEKRSLSAKFGSLFSGGGGSNPSTPRLHATSNPSLRCRTNPSSPKSKRSSISTPASDDGGMGMGRNPRRVFQSLSEPSSPKSPSKFALFKASFLSISRVSRCGVCSQSVRTGDAAAVFTAECSHSFHLLCITPNAALVCPVCSAIWRHSPLARPDDGGKGGEGHAAAQPDQHQHRHRHRRPDMDSKRSNSSRERGGESTKPTTAAAKVYDDDEPLLLSGAMRFNPIPEADDEEEDSKDQDKQGGGGGGGGAFPMAMDRCYPRHHPPSSGSSGVAVCVMPDAALISTGRSHRNYVITLKVKAPHTTAAAADPSLRAPIDLVTVLDVRGSMTGAKLHMLKRAMRQLVSSLGSRDRLSIVVFTSNVAKRLLPLQRMSRQGQRSARQIVDRLIPVSIKQGHGDGDGAGDALALRKATKVLEDRRECNPVATIMLLSDGQQRNADDRRTTTGPTRFAHLEIPIHASGPGNAQMQQGCRPSEPEGNPFNQCVLGGLLSTVFRDVRLQFALPAAAGEISAVYSSCEGGGIGSGRAVAVVLEGDCFRLGDLHAGEERDLLVELRVPADGGGPMSMSMPMPMSVRCSYRNAVTLELIRGREQVVPMPPSSSSSSLRLRNLFVASRAIVESRRLAVDHKDFATAQHLLSSARSLLLLQADEDLLLGLEAALLDLQRLRHSGQAPPPPSAAFDDRREALTPMSAWRAAERLAKLAIMRKSLNRVSDLHGFENARF